MQARGIAPEDARDYAPIGCIELTIPGRANPHAVSGWFNAAKCLELALFDGRDPRSGEQLGPRSGLLTGFDTFEAFFDAAVVQGERGIQRLTQLTQTAHVPCAEAQSVSALVKDD